MYDAIALDSPSRATILLIDWTSTATVSSTTSAVPTTPRSGAIFLKTQGLVPVSLNHKENMTVAGICLITKV